MQGPDSTDQANGKDFTKKQSEFSMREAHHGFPHIAGVLLAAISGGGG
jgi:hypothetical protein